MYQNTKANKSRCWVTLSAAFAILATVTSADAAAEAFKAEPSDLAAIKDTMSAYNVALNAGKAASVASLYSNDGVFMRPNSNSAVGVDAVRAAYEKVLGAISFNIAFTFNEIVQVSPVYAYVRAHSVGTMRTISTGTAMSESNQELFILKKGDDDHWKIARYSFSQIETPQPR